MWLFDTSFVIDLFKHDKKALKKAEETDSSPSIKAISVVTAHEVLRGLHYIGDEEKLKLGEASLSRFEIIPYTYEIAKRAAEIDASLIKKGEMLPFPDVVIAATAITYDLSLVTREDHFKRIEGLEVEEY
ncbi:putative nucleic acid-binding protein, contains PIN domain [Archaeoglobus sulfaticallidus PM70-1]|uniref:Ribonuclease VapC n=1 Tax=Archaeoglobus sulfaticallidus PM70-1 TaxID=387631 RepID=N0BCV0_9EURY|nr:type II toxin-antitoxin system VapC family toxin [Archaeoglobus sulfaticallidus]AGK60042.1 putative nucleic acid-binding protein, contains PIN domain [Archaeoglobus sulfaticallidus PM70-1]